MYSTREPSKIEIYSSKTVVIFKPYPNSLTAGFTPGKRYKAISTIAPDGATTGDTWYWLVDNTGRRNLKIEGEFIQVPYDETIDSDSFVYFEDNKIKLREEIDFSNIREIAKDLKEFADKNNL